MNAVQLALVAVLLPVAVALFLLVAAPVRRAGWPAAALSLAGAIGSLIASVWLLWRQTVLPEQALLEEVRWLPEAGSSAATIGVLVDGVSASMLVVVALVATCVQVFSVGYMAHEPKHDFGRYFTWHSLFLFSMQGLVLAPNLLQLFVCWELVGLCSYLLIGFYWQKGSAGKAAVKAFWVTKLADTGLLLGLIVQYAATGSFGWGPETVSTLQAAGAALPAVGLLYFLAVMGKSAQFPLHVWLPDAMEGPTPVSALLHAATMVAAGVYLIVRAYPIFAASEAVMTAFGVVGGFTAVFAACVAVVQTDIKKVLAYSTCSQLGYMVAALGTGSFMAGYLHLTTHAFFKALLFLAAGSAIHAVHSNELKDMGGLARRMPVTGAAFVIGCLALAGVPLLSGFYSKDMVLESLLHAAQEHPVFWFPLVTCTVSAGITAYYMGKAAVLAFFGRASSHAEHAHESGPSMALPLIVLALPAVGAGWMTGVMANLWGVPDVHFAVVHFTPIGIVATTLALGGLAVAWIKHAQGGLGGLDAAFAPLGALARSGIVDRAWDTAWRRGVLVASAGLAWFDRYVVDGLMNFTGVGFLEAGTVVRRMQTGRASDYLWAISLGILLLAVYSQARMWVG
jgi:NADH-quinone oxidoreductase subunit L